MGQKTNFLLSVLLVTTIASCVSSSGDIASDSGTTAAIEKKSSSDISSATSTVKFEPFNNIDEVRQKLSAIGIGEFGNWGGDEMGSYMSITPYYQFGDGTPKNNLAYYLEGDKPNSIKTLQLVLNINNDNKKSALAKFAEIIGKTCTALGLPPDTKTMAAAKAGKELRAESGTYMTRTEQEKSRTETWKFIIETK